MPKQETAQQLTERIRGEVLSFAQELYLRDPQSVFRAQDVVSGRPDLKDQADRIAQEIRQLCAEARLSIVEADDDNEIDDTAQIGYRFNPAGANHGLPKHYTNLVAIARGAFGTVYRGWHSVLGLEVAIKILRNIGNAERLQRFVQESKILYTLSHPRIPRCIEAGLTLDGSRPYFVMPYVQGSQSLDELLETTPKLEITRALKIAYYLADALDYAHAKGIVHRDIKPGNILMTGSEECLLLDFGIAKWTSSSAELASAASPQTRTGEIFGTPVYMSPERFDELRDPRGDIYSVGVVLFEMVTGRRPFSIPQTSRTIDQIAQVVKTSAAAFTKEEEARIPASVRSVILRCLAKRPSDRFAGARELATAINSSLHELGASIETLPERNKSKRPLVLAMILVLVSLGAAYVWTRQHDDPAAKTDPTNEQKVVQNSPGPADSPVRNPGPKDSPPPVDSKPLDPIPKEPLPPTPPEPTIAEKLARAKKAFEGGDPKSAHSQLGPILAAEPENVDAHELRARILAEVGSSPADASAALDDLALVFKAKTPNDELKRLKAFLLYKLHKIKAARDVLDELSERSKVDRILSAKASLRLIEPSRAAADLRAPGVQAEQLGELVRLCLFIHENAVAEKPSELLALSTALDNLRARTSEIEKLADPDNLLAAPAYFFQAVALQRLGFETQAGALVTRAMNADPAFADPQKRGSEPANLNTPAVRYETLAQLAWISLEKEDLPPAEELVKISRIVPAGARDAILAPLERELVLLRKFASGDYAEILKAYAGSPIPDGKNLALFKTASRIYTGVTFEDVKPGKIKWIPHELPTPADAPGAKHKLTENGFEIETADREAEFITDGAVAEYGYEVTLTFEPKSDKAFAAIVLKVHETKDNSGRSSFVRFTKRCVEVIERRDVADWKVFAKQDPPADYKYTVAVFRASNYTLIFLNRKLFSVLDQVEVQLPGPVNCSVQNGKIVVEAVRLLR